MELQNTNGEMLPSPRLFVLFILTSLRVLRVLLLYPVPVLLL